MTKFIQMSNRIELAGEQEESLDIVALIMKYLNYNANENHEFE